MFFLSSCCFSFNVGVRGAELYPTRSICTVLCAFDLFITITTTPSSILSQNKHIPTNFSTVIISISSWLYIYIFLLGLIKFIYLELYFYFLFLIPLAPKVIIIAIIFVFIFYYLVIKTHLTIY